MSTSSRIAMVLPNGVTKSIYCHYDGYLEGVGKILYENYNTTEKVNELLNLGNLSELDINTDLCVAYIRDCGEDDHYNKLHITLTTKELVDFYKNTYEEFLYLWDTNKETWFVLDDASDLLDFIFVPLSEYIKLEDKKEEISKSNWVEIYCTSNDLNTNNDEKYFINLDSILYLNRIVGDHYDYYIMTKYNEIIKNIVKPDYNEMKKLLEG